MEHGETLSRIAAALDEATRAVARFVPGEVEARAKSGGDPVTEADTLVDAILKRALHRPGEGWLSEETVDDRTRLDHRRVWVVDPLDGTREFVTGLPEWSISIGLVEDGEAVAGGIACPPRDEIYLGARGHGVTLNGRPVQVSSRPGLEGAEVLASRTEVDRGRWQPFAAAPFRVVPLGSVAYKLARVAAGLADATWTLVPKHEWDVAAGVALVLAAGGRITAGSHDEERFNRPEPLLSRLLAAPPQLFPAIESEIANRTGSAV
jgi:myo-inositol-1(or 4)-monophosphatase